MYCYYSLINIIVHCMKLKCSNVDRRFSLWASKIVSWMSISKVLSYQSCHECVFHYVLQVHRFEQQTSFSWSINSVHVICWSVVRPSKTQDTFFNLHPLHHGHPLSPPSSRQPRLEAVIILLVNCKMNVNKMNNLYGEHKLLYEPGVLKGLLPRSRTVQSGTLRCPASVVYRVEVLCES